MLTCYIVVKIIPQDLLRKYIMYARDKVYPRLADIDHQKLEKLYSELRRESMVRQAFPFRQCDVFRLI